MKTWILTLTMLTAVAVASSATAQTLSPSASRGPIPVTGEVSAFCSLSAVNGGQESFDLGVLVDTSTGLLASDLAAEPKTLGASFCNARSNITVSASPLTAQTFTSTPPAGFSRTVDYVAQAAGWTPTPARFDTAASANAAASQLQASPLSADIVVSLSDFSTRGGALRLAGDDVYQGSVSVTLGVVN